jgi:hypothetical protein
LITFLGAHVGGRTETPSCHSHQENVDQCGKGKDSQKCDAIVNGSLGPSRSWIQVESGWRIAYWQVGKYIPPLERGIQGMRSTSALVQDLSELIAGHVKEFFALGSEGVLFCEYGRWIRMSIGQIVAIQFKRSESDRLPRKEPYCIASERWSDCGESSSLFRDSFRIRDAISAPSSSSSTLAMRQSNRSSSRGESTLLSCFRRGLNRRFDAGPPTSRRMRPWGTRSRRRKQPKPVQLIDWDERLIGSGSAAVERVAKQLEAACCDPERSPRTAEVVVIETGPAKQPSSPRKEGL